MGSEGRGRCGGPRMPKQGSLAFTLSEMRAAKSFEQRLVS